jgi:hypothetical protein
MPTYWISIREDNVEKYDLVREKICIADLPGIEDNLLSLSIEDWLSKNCAFTVPIVLVSLN